MEKLVVDSSVAVKWFVVEPYSPQAHLLLDGYQTGALNFLAPDLINAEVGNVIWKKQMFQGLTAKDAQLIIDAFRMLSFELTSTASLLNEAYRLAVAHQRTVYDALYLALSTRERCRFVTADERLVNSIQSAFPNVFWLGAWS